MEERKGVYFASDVHIGADVGDPAEREARFVRFLKSIPSSAKALYLLGDIWDFWYEYSELMPKDGARVTAVLLNLVHDGVEVHFFPGNHDMWVRDFFESNGIIMHSQPYFGSIEGKEFCLGHGDIIGGTDIGYRFLHWVYTSPVIQFIFRLMDPRLLFKLTRRWFRFSRNSHKPFEFDPERQRIVQWARETAKSRKVDYFVFGHFHRDVRLTLEDGVEFFIMGDWVSDSPYFYFDGVSLQAKTFEG